MTKTWAQVEPDLTHDLDRILRLAAAARKNRSWEKLSELLEEASELAHIAGIEIQLPQIKGR